jgi:hypothetical protein
MIAEACVAARLAVAADELRAPAGDRSEPVALLHRWKGSSDAITARIHATRARGCSSPAPAARSSFRACKRASPSSGVRCSPRTRCRNHSKHGARYRIEAGGAVPLGCSWHLLPGGSTSAPAGSAPPPQPREGSVRELTRGLVTRCRVESQALVSAGRLRQAEPPLRNALTADLNGSGWSTQG